MKVYEFNPFFLDDPIGFICPEVTYTRLKKRWVKSEYGIFKFPNEANNDDITPEEAEKLQFRSLEGFKYYLHELGLPDKDTPGMLAHYLEHYISRGGKAETWLTFLLKDVTENPNTYPTYFIIPIKKFCDDELAKIGYTSGIKEPKKEGANGIKKYKNAGDFYAFTYILNCCANGINPSDIAQSERENKISKEYNRQLKENKKGIQTIFPAHSTINKRYNDGKVFFNSQIIRDKEQQKQIIEKIKEQLPKNDDWKKAVLSIVKDNSALKNFISTFT